VKNIPKDIKERTPGIPWRKIAGLRDVLIHEYSGVNIERTWPIITKDIYELRTKLIELKKELS
jgi:uncharacterized protein with HEPN domain